MKIWVVVLSGLILIVFFVLFGYLSFAYYVKATSYIYSLSYAERNDSLIRLYDDFSLGKLGGILVYISDGSKPGIWFWYKNRLKFVSVDHQSVFSVYKGCDLEVFNMMNNGGDRTMPRRIYTSLSDLKKEFVKSGELVTILLAKNVDGNRVNVVRELWMQDWWSFKNGDMKIQCKK